jgi:hypothetical protein
MAFVGLPITHFHFEPETCKKRKTPASTKERSVSPILVVNSRVTKGRCLEKISSFLLFLKTSLVDIDGNLDRLRLLNGL